MKVQRAAGFFEKFYDPEYQASKDIKVTEDTQEGEFKLYMGGIPNSMNEEEVRKLCESFGMLKYFNLGKDHATGQTKGFCFFEYQDSRAFEKALKGLNGLEIGDRKLRVQKATAQEPRVKNKDREPSNATGSFLGSFPNILDEYVQAMITIPISAFTPSSVIQLLNLVSVQDLMDEQVYTEVLKDVTDECSKYGLVDKVEIPRPDDRGFCCPAVGKVFVKYHYLTEAKIARYKLNGRSYRKRTVIASFYSEERFLAKDYLLKG
eukprot:TRINITY_DN11013_c0_g1_i1.p1 TRINITY_DN11013_c0_g1~~TRINITY_DN11013_c0_g1_i1.p1  ORF type:complete len:263 (-),score=61.86 TRINITY_DN11013_c0_g1_i1:174-962(-)